MADTSFNISPWKGVQMFLVLLWWSIHFFWHHVHLCWGAIWGYFSAYFFMFLYFLRTVQYFIMKLCTHVLGSTLMVTSPKNMSCSALLGARPFFWEGGGGRGVQLNLAYIYMFLYFLKTVQYFLIKFCKNVLGITLMVTALLKR